MRQVEHGMGRAAQYLRAGALASGLLLSACGGGFTPTHAQTDPAQVLAAQRADHAQVRGLRAEARIDQRGEQGRIRGTVMMFVQRPASLRFDAMSQFGPVSVLTSDGEAFALSSFRDKRFIYGPACAENVARMLRFPMTVQQTVEFLLGGTALIDAPAPSMHWDREAAAYVIELDGADGYRQRLHLGLRGADRDAALAAQRFDLQRSELWAPDGTALWRVTFDDYRSVQTDAVAVRWPYRVHVVQPASDLDTLIRYKEVALNPTIPDGAFAQQPVGGMQVEESPCE